MREREGRRGVWTVDTLSYQISYVICDNDAMSASVIT